MLIALTNWTMIILSLKSKKKKKNWKQEFMQNNIWMCVIKWAVSGLFVLSWAGHLADLGLILVFSFYSRLGFKKKKKKKNQIRVRLWQRDIYYALKMKVVLTTSHLLNSITSHPHKHSSNSRRALSLHGWALKRQEYGYLSEFSRGFQLNGKSMLPISLI